MDYLVAIGEMLDPAVYALLDVLLFPFFYNELTAGEDVREWLNGEAGWSYGVAIVLCATYFTVIVAVTKFIELLGSKFRFRR
ncbi:hypothetical protein [Marinobacterium jannaschii]|uniref:hypothetical protein n=1 Tax=Marinobacterium jannaschii TaxID=64970 RepID=UPI000488395E|nr:hypothetical protein [Marinobacterium jannaschii]